MMTPFESFEKRAATARRDAPPPVDVTAAVMRAVDAPRTSDRVLYVFSALSAAAAIIVAFAGVALYRQSTDPLIGLMVEASRIVQ